jgi:hypothetical protein
LIAFGAVAEAAGLEATVIAFLGDPVFALFLGLLGAYLLAWRTLTKERVEEAMGAGFNATGQILLITGIGGSLGAVIGETGLDKILGELLSAEAGTPALLTILLALVHRGRLAPRHRLDLGRDHHRGGHTGPDNGQHRSPRVRVPQRHHSPIVRDPPQEPGVVVERETCGIALDLDAPVEDQLHPVFGVQPERYRVFTRAVEARCVPFHMLRDPIVRA